jgi:uncharacterized metal-binding protein YceD (DUF177 family)
MERRTDAAPLLFESSPMSSPAEPRPTRLRTAGLSPRKPTRFSYRPDAEARRALAQVTGLLALYHLEMTGEITPSGQDGLVLTATLVARAEQACVVTLAPVPAEIAERFARRYVAGLAIPEGEEAEMPEDDSVEPLPEVIDLADIAAEALALALPLYPRAPGAEFVSTQHAPAGVAPLADADLKPFAGLQDLARQLSAKVKPGSE